MIEVEITCLCGQIKLADLGLSLTKGQTVYVSWELAQASKELVAARLAKGVRVREVQRARNMRPAPVRQRVFSWGKRTPPVSPATLSPSRSISAASQLPVAASQLPVVAIDMGGIRRIVREEVTGALREVLHKVSDDSEGSAPSFTSIVGEVEGGLQEAVVQDKVSKAKRKVQNRAGHPGV